MRRAKPEHWLRKKSKVKGIIIRVRKEVLKYDGSWIKFNDNAIILLKKRLNTHGKKIIGPVTYSVRREKFKNAFAGIV